MILIDIDGTLIKKQKEIDYDSWVVDPNMISFLQQMTGCRIVFRRYCQKPINATSNLQGDQFKTPNL